MTRDEVVKKFRDEAAMEGFAAVSHEHMTFAADTIEDLVKALAFVKAERDHWHSLVPVADRVKFPFNLHSLPTS